MAFVSTYSAPPGFQVPAAFDRSGHPGLHQLLVLRDVGGGTSLVVKWRSLREFQTGSARVEAALGVHSVSVRGAVESTTPPEKSWWRLLVKRVPKVVVGTIACIGVLETLRNRYVDLFGGVEVHLSVPDRREWRAVAGDLFEARVEGVNQSSLPANSTRIRGRAVSGPVGGPGSALASIGFDPRSSVAEAVAVGGARELRVVGSIRAGEEIEIDNPDAMVRSVPLAIEAIASAGFLRFEERVPLSAAIELWPRTGMVLAPSGTELREKPGTRTRVRIRCMFGRAAPREREILFSLDPSSTLCVEGLDPIGDGVRLVNRKFPVTKDKKRLRWTIAAVPAFTRIEFDVLLTCATPVDEATWNAGFESVRREIDVEIEP